MKKIRITFENGDIVFGILDEVNSPKTSSIIWDALPIESVAVQSRWSGREVNLELDLKEPPPRESQSIYTSFGDLCYWRNWRYPEDDNTKHVVAIYYGAEMTRSNSGEEPVNIIGQIENKYLNKIKEIGERIWIEGIEKIRIEQMKEDK